MNEWREQAACAGNRGMFRQGAGIPWLELDRAIRAATGRRWYTPTDGPEEGVASDWLLTDGYVAELLGVSQRTVVRWRTDDHVPLCVIDSVSTALGYHPLEVWPAWGAA